MAVEKDSPNEDELLQRQKCLDKLVKQLNEKDFLAYVSFKISHELRGSLVSILAITQIIDKSSLTEENLMFITWIREKSEQLDRDVASLNSDIARFIN